MRMFERSTVRLAILLALVIAIAAIGGANWVSFPVDPSFGV